MSQCLTKAPTTSHMTKDAAGEVLTEPGLTNIATLVEQELTMRSSIEAIRSP